MHYQKECGGHKRRSLFTPAFCSHPNGAIYAPFSTVSVSGNSAIMGVVRGMTLTWSDNAGFHCDEATENLLSRWWAATYLSRVFLRFQTASNFLR